jgi:hypothetical protein
VLQSFIEVHRLFGRVNLLITCLAYSSTVNSETLLSLKSSAHFQQTAQHKTPEKKKILSTGTGITPQIPSVLAHSGPPASSYNTTVNNDTIYIRMR